MAKTEINLLARYPKAKRNVKARLGNKEENRRIALQLPIYSAGVRTRLAAERGVELRASEAMYLSFEGPQAVMPLEERGKSFDELVMAAEHRLVQTLDDIAAGHYPPRPETRNLCGMCAFVAVCRTPGGLPAGPEAADE